MKYSRGDVVEVKRQRGQKNFLVVYCGVAYYAALNMSGNGKAAYKLLDGDIVRKVGEAKDHPWLENFKERPSQDGEKHIILVTEGDEAFFAQVKGHEDEYWANGQTAPEAIGNLIVLHGEALGIAIKAKE